MSRAMGLTTDIRGTKQLHLSPSDLTELIVSLGGVKFWIVSVAPLYIGWVLAHAPAQRHLFIDDLRVVLGTIVVGPLLGTFTLLLNVYHDMGTTDRINPRKKYVQVVEELVGEGLMERDTLLLASFGFAAMGLVIAAYISGSLVGYNPAEAGGGFTSLVGKQGFLIRTMAVRLGVNRTLLIGFVLQVLSVALLLLGWSARLFPFNGTAYNSMADLWPFLALQILFYAVFIRRATVGRIWALLLLLSILQALGVILMLWRFVGEQTWSP